MQSTSHHLELESCCDQSHSERSELLASQRQADHHQAIPMTFRVPLKVNPDRTRSDTI